MRNYLSPEDRIMLVDLIEMAKASGNHAAAKYNEDILRQGYWPESKNPVAGSFFLFKPILKT